MSETKLKMKFGNIEFEIESDSETVEKERKSFLETLPGIISLSSNFIVMDSQNQQKVLDETRLVEDNTANIPRLANMNINTFISEKGFLTENDICLGVIYFMNLYEDVDIVNTNSLKERMKSAKLILPKNPSQCFGALTQKGFIQPNGEIEKGIKSYYITQQGKNYIDSYVKKEKKKSVVKRNTSKQIESRYSVITKQDLNLEKYPDINELKTTKDKVMMTMYLFSKEDKGEYFTANDIIYLFSKLFNEKLTNDMVSSLFKNKSTGKYFDKRNIQDNRKVNEYKQLNIGTKYVEKNILV